MNVVSVLLMWFLGAGAQSPTAIPKPTDCNQALAAGPSAAAAEMCLGEAQLKLADVSPKSGPDLIQWRGSRERLRQLEVAVEHYRRAITLASSADTKSRGLDALAHLYDAQHLNEIDQLESVLRELVALEPNELAPLSRLSRVQEDQGRIDVAEETLLSARHRKPDEIEPYKMLAQFYARRASALNEERKKEKPVESANRPGEPDEHGVYRVGGGVELPRRLETPQYPKEAQAAGIQGVVIAELVVSDAGVVTDARVLRSIPMLDEPALKAVRQWRFEPAIVDGKPVPVRMTVTVNFTTR